MQCTHTSLFGSHITGEQGEVRLRSDIERVLSPSWSLAQPHEEPDLSLTWGSVGYLVLSLEAGERGRDQRRLMRSLWAGRLARQQRLVFVTRHSDDLGSESEEHDDILSVKTDMTEYLAHILCLAGLHYSLTQWPLASFTLLTTDSVLISPEAVSRLASRHSVSSNRVLGSLYKRYSPARQAQAPHHTSEAEWPWSMYPPFLDPGLMMFTQDTLTPILQHSASVPLFKHYEIWLTGLVSLQAEVIRMGFKDSLMARPQPLPGPHRDCYWAGRAGVGGVTSEDAEVRSWAQRLAGVRGCEVREAREVSNTCDVRRR